MVVVSIGKFYTSRDEHLNLNIGLGPGNTSWIAYSFLNCHLFKENDCLIPSIVEYSFPSFLVISPDTKYSV